MNLAHNRLEISSQALEKETFDRLDSAAIKIILDDKYETAVCKKRDNELNQHKRAQIQIGALGL
jgi:hypothetical protein